MNKKGLAVTRGGGRGSMKCSLCGKPMKKSRGVYRYAESGLKDVVLSGIPLYRCPRGHVDHVISNPAGLHRLIAAKLLAHKLDFDAVAFLRKEAGISRRDVAGLLLLGKNENALAGIDRKGGEPLENWEDRLLRFGFLRAIEERAGCLLPGLTWRDCLNKKPRPKPLRITENDVRALSDPFACVARQEGRSGKPRLAPRRPFVSVRAAGS